MSDFYHLSIYISICLSIYISIYLYCYLGFPSGASGKESACQFRRHKRCEFDPWVGNIPWRMAWQLTSVILPGESHGQKSLVGYSSKCRTWLKRLSMHAHIYLSIYVSIFLSIYLSIYHLYIFLPIGFLHSSVGKESTCNAGDPG